MPQYVTRGVGIVVHWSTHDAVFRTADGQRVAMTMHPYCGPIFEIDGEGYHPDEDDPIWDQFNGWRSHQKGAM